MKDHVASRWDGAILVCGKCSKKLGGAPLAKLLRKQPGFGKGRKAELGVVETRCLGICPKRGVVVVDTRAPGRWRIVPEGADAGTLAVELRMMSSPSPAQG